MHDETGGAHGSGSSGGGDGAQAVSEPLGMRCIYEEKREAALSIEARCAVPHAAPTLHARKKTRRSNREAVRSGARAGISVCRYKNYRASYLDCACLTCSQLAFAKSTSPCVGPSNLLPKSVISYSTRGGTSGNSSRITIPSRSRFFRVDESIRCEIPGTARSSSENRARPPRRSSERPRKIVHLSPIFVSSSQTAVRSELLQTAAGSRGPGVLGFLITYLGVSR